jgi:hypothetical protein
MPAYSFNTHYSASKGSVLAISLVILTAITLVSVAAMQRSGLQTRMVNNIELKATGFHVANSELEDIYDFFGTQASATQALSIPLSEFDIAEVDKVDDSGDVIKDASGDAITEQVQEFNPVPTGHYSTYSNYTQYGSSSSSNSSPPKVNVISSIEHTGVRSSLVEGFSIGTFVEFGFKSIAITSHPISGQELSNQTIGINYIAPAG